MANKWRSLCVTFLLLGWITSCSTQQFIERSTHEKMYSNAMAKEMNYSVYTPPDWSRSEKLPILILLHGGKDDHTTFDRYQVGQHLDRLYEQNALPRVVIVNPDGELGFWENWHDGTRNYRSWVMEDLLAHVQATHNTLPCPDHCFVTGMSMGAHGAMRFAYHESDKLSSVAAISGVIISSENTKLSFRQRLFSLFIPLKRIWGDPDKNSAELSKQDPYKSWISDQKLIDTPLLLVWGDSERKSIRTSNEKFQQHLKTHGKKHSWYVYNGRHLWVDWKEPIAQSIRYHVTGEVDLKSN